MARHPDVTSTARPIPQDKENHPIGTRFRCSLRWQRRNPNVHAAGLDRQAGTRRSGALCRQLTTIRHSTQRHLQAPLDKPVTNTINSSPLQIARPRAQISLASPRDRTLSHPENPTCPAPKNSGPHRLGFSQLSPSTMRCSILPANSSQLSPAAQLPQSAVRSSTIAK